MPDKPQNFWQELKRRKVIRVIIGYAAASYVILELISIIAEPFGLPGWTLKLVFVLLCVGFIISVVISWLYDITPEGVKKTKPAKSGVEKEKASKAGKRGLKTSDIIIAVLLIAVIVLVYPKIFKPDKLKQLRQKGEISIAVMPFQNLTGDTLKNFWQLMVQEGLINTLSNSEELKVRQTESTYALLQNSDLSNYASLSPSLASTISKKLDAGVFIHGSISQVGTLIRLNAKLVDSETEEVFKSFQIDGTPENILNVSDSLSRMLKDYLIISVLEKELSHELKHYLSSTESAEAVKYFMEGNMAFYKRDYAASRELFYKALEADSNFVAAVVKIAVSYGNQGIYEEAKKWSLKAWEKRDRMSRLEKLYTGWIYNIYYGDPYEELKYIRQIIELDDQIAAAYYILGITYNQLFQYNKAIPEFERALELYDKWEVKPLWVYNYTALGEAYHKTGQFGKEKRLYKKAEKDFPGDPVLLSMQATLALSTGKTEAADEYIDRYISALEERSYSGAAIASILGGIYLEAGMLQRAEEKYREALSLQPGRARWMNNLAYILIDNEIDIEEGLELAEKALETEPDNYLFLDTRGWGLYKQGNYQEALENLERSWELKPIYDHDIYLHLEAANKAVANQSGSTN
ncbi:MAG: tetratricopeptide repeat protein [Bacteroidales bacterium]|nr:tetratricopeptide repeat protein [Bacteroidales bacterium]